MLCCGAAKVATHRATAQGKLRDTLRQLKTPDKLLINLMHGISSWERLQSGGKPSSLYRGSVVPEDVAVVQAFSDQTDIGWGQLLRGRISKRWAEAFKTPMRQDMPNNFSATSWVKQVVRALWEYSISL
jgi:hypothetical protein